MADIFHEVDEEVRRERLRRLWDQYGLYLIILALLIVLAIAGWRTWEYFENQRAAESGSQFEAAMALAEAGKQQEAEQAFARIAQTGTSGYRTLARLREAEAMIARDRAAAVANFDAISRDSGVDLKLRDLAAVRAGFLLVDTAPLPDMEKRLEPLTGSGRAFRHTARELLALSAFRTKDLQAFRRWADLISSDAETPVGMRNRLDAMLALAETAKG